MLFVIIINKSIAKLHRALGNKDINEDTCFDPKRLKREVIDQQRERRAWVN